MAKPEHEYSRRAGRLHPCAGLVPGLTERILAADPDGGVATS
jgi:hypothetical protein